MPPGMNSVTSFHRWAAIFIRMAGSGAGVALLLLLLLLLPLLLLLLPEPIVAVRESLTDREGPPPATHAERDDVKIGLSRGRPAAVRTNGPPVRQSGAGGTMPAVNGDSRNGNGGVRGMRGGVAMWLRPEPDRPRRTATEPAPPNVDDTRRAVAPGPCACVCFRTRMELWRRSAVVMVTRHGERIWSMAGARLCAVLRYVNVRCGVGRLPRPPSHGVRDFSSSRARRLCPPFRPDGTPVQPCVAEYRCTTRDVLSKGAQ